MAFYLAPFCYGTMSITYTMDLLCLELWQEGGIRTISEVIQFKEKKKKRNYDQSANKVPTPTMMMGLSPIILVSLCSTSDMWRICITERDEETHTTTTTTEPKCIEKKRYFCVCLAIKLKKKIFMKWILANFSLSAKTKILISKATTSSKGLFRWSVISHIGT